MYKDASPVSTEPPSYFSCLGEIILGISQLAPGSRHSVPRGTTKHVLKGAAPECHSGLSHLLGAKVCMVNTYVVLLA